ncbi:aminotransferase class III-fold pyridoxal phosphate-dependent enzyme [Candidatus Palauibacter soopunensis]|uniref:aminotransferase class III-fold pyridoxal phosphate-dependent enzyme n=1 Tax=Candidatus Palauibacter soopunensis TaxID=3056739 RepID=UPI0023866248|nr:aminotransferase class III-fold pyridoxal phosphate-dependent enzyme [Candidatus Palauibacter soopunensis]MDE2877742.1 aminotransferase class III-fold pyridoxal phosphate-dependent enzyme [Candidatus Palauibacter soopunensis]
METLDTAYAGGRPSLGEGEAARLAAEGWGVEGQARECASERDRVFEIRGANGPLGYLKVSNALERRSVLGAEAAILDGLTSQSCYRLPTWRATAGGESLIERALDGRTHLIRFLDPVPGVSLDRYRPHGPELRRQIGRMVGILDRSLASGPEAGRVAIEDRPMIWDLRGAATLVAENLVAIPDPGRRAILSHILERYAEVVSPRRAGLREGPIYNDANPANIHVDPARILDGAPKLVGVVDFGDAMRSWTIADLAVACAYAGLGTRDPVGAFCDVALGYAAEYELTEAEADVVYELARLRLALSVTVSSVRGAQEPDNEYLLVSRAPAWEVLGHLDATPPNLGRFRLREACGHAPCPSTARVIAALERAAPDAAPVLDPDPRTAPTVTLDLSVESGDDGGTFDPSDHAAFSQRLFDRMRDAGAAVGIGRYDEVRWWYTGEAFRAPGNEMDEWRTVHLGVDLFAEPGTPVLTPLGGRVVSVQDNADRLDYGPTIILEHELEDPAGGADGPVRFRTLFGHLSAEALSKVAPGDVVEAGGTIGWIGAPPANGDWAPHLHFQIFLDPLGYEGTFPGVAAPSARGTWTAVSPDPNHLLQLPGEAAAPRPRSHAALVEDRNRWLGPSLSLSYGRPLHIVRGRGSRLYDIDGQPFLDCVNNVAHVGHSHPRVNEAARRQMTALNTNTRYLHETILEYTERLAALFPAPLDVCFLVCSGTEANELALRMARTHTGKVGAVVLDGAYHGNSSSVVNLSPYKFNGPGGKGLRPWVRMAPMPDLFRGIHRGPERDVAPLYAAYVGDAARALETEPTWFEERPPGAAAFFHESILSCGGQIPLPSGYLAASYAAAREHGAVCVADEVQVGFGRVGSHFWAFEEHDVVPDIVTLGKPIGNGHPLAAVITTREIAESFANGMEYFNTYGGNPVSCAIGLAVLDVIEDEGLRENAAVVGRRLLAGLEHLRDRHAPVGDARGRGLFTGIEFVREGDDLEPAADLADAAVQRTRDKGILLSTDGPDHNVIKMKPPLVFSEADADLLISNLDDILTETTFQP